MAKYLEGLEFIQLVQPGTSDTTLMQMSRPHLVGRVAFIDQKDVDEVERFMLQLANGATMAKVPGYSIFLLPGGTLDNESTSKEETISVLRRMAQYTLFEFVKAREHRCLRYKDGIDVDAAKAAQSEKSYYYSRLRKAKKAAKLAQDED